MNLTCEKLFAFSKDIKNRKFFSVSREVLVPYTRCIHWMARFVPRRWCGFKRQVWWKRICPGSQSAGVRLTCAFGSGKPGQSVRTWTSGRWSRSDCQGTTRKMTGETWEWRRRDGQKRHAHSTNVVLILRSASVFPHKDVRHLRTQMCARHVKNENVERATNECVYTHSRTHTLIASMWVAKLTDILLCCVCTHDKWTFWANANAKDVKSNVRDVSENKDVNCARVHPCPVTGVWLSVYLHTNASLPLCMRACLDIEQLPKFYHAFHFIQSSMLEFVPFWWQRLYVQTECRKRRSTECNGNENWSASHDALKNCLTLRPTRRKDGCNGNEHTKSKITESEIEFRRNFENPGFSTQLNCS